MPEMDSVLIEKTARSLKKHAQSRAQPVYLQITTKGSLADKKSVTPILIKLPHSLYQPLDVCSICLIVRDPQRIFQQVLEVDKKSPTHRMFSEIISVSKLKSRLKHDKTTKNSNFLESYDLILVEEKVAGLLPAIVGAQLYRSGRIPVPVAVTSPQKYIQKAQARKSHDDESTASTKTAKFLKKNSVDADLVKKQVRRIHKCTSLCVGPGNLLSIPVGYCGMSTKELSENIMAALQLLVNDVLRPQKGWSFVEKAHIKTPESVALPIVEQPQQLSKALK